MDSINHSPSIEFNFVNELGNSIQIIIKNENTSATKYSTGESMNYNGIDIIMSGPTSTSENVITYMEAEILFQSLKAFLKK